LFIAGKTGKLVFQALLEDPNYEPVGLVRTPKSARKLVKETSCGLDHVMVCDVTTLHQTPTDGNVVDDDDSTMGCSGAEAMIICTSAVPVMKKWSLAKAFAKIPWNMIRRKKAFDFRSLRFGFREGQYPEKVDYEGQMAQIDLAKKAGIKQVVVISSMGGTDPTNFLNSIGKNPDGTGNGDILLWKRKAERYLVEVCQYVFCNIVCQYTSHFSLHLFLFYCNNVYQSGLYYTIIHPGGLKDTPGGVEEFILDVDDALLQRKPRSISRADVAQLAVAALSVADQNNVSFDCITTAAAAAEEEDSSSTTPKSAEEVLEDFLKLGKTANYKL